MTARFETPLAQSQSHARSRRALLAGALAGLGAWAASAIGRADVVHATDGQPLLQGADNSGATSSVVRISTATAALQGVSDATSGTSYGLRGRNSSTAGAGVLGVGGATSGTSPGVLGQASANPNGTGVKGEGPGRGVYGISAAGTGVLGTSSSGIGVWATSTTGYGVYASSSSGLGVYGNSGSGYGVYGSSTSSFGVYGLSSSGHGVHGSSPTGYAGYFAGKVYTTRWYELAEVNTPGSPGANRARLFIRDNGSGKTEVCVKFANGTLKVLATEG